jgi:hypothetical protein
MSALDKTSGGTTVPRFLAVADNRDFFYLMKKRGATPHTPLHPGVAGGSPSSLASPASPASPASL